MIRNIRHIQIKKIAYTPNLFKAIITYEAHPTEYDESDDIEYQKGLMNKLINDNWFVNCRPCADMEKHRRSIDRWER